MFLTDRTRVIEVLDLSTEMILEDNELAEIEKLDQSPDAAPTRIILPVRAGFDYSGVSDSVRLNAEAAAGRIQKTMRSSIIEVGNDLSSVKESLGHGKFGEWLKFYFDMSERTAENYMNAAREFANAPDVLDLLPHGTVYRLAARSTPAEVRKKVFDQINSGTLPEKKAVEELIASSRPARRQRVAVRNEVEQAVNQSEIGKPSSRSTGSSSEPPIVPEVHPALPPHAGCVEANTTAQNQAAEPRAEREEAEALCATSNGNGQAMPDQLARNIVKVLKERFGPKFPILRNAVLKTGGAKLELALRET
ncbi:DUF3102 domain-containing protein [Mesorhizobium sp. 10J20-29]